MTDMTATSESSMVRLTTPAKAEYVLLARLALSAVCRLTSLRQDDAADLKLAITEAATMRGGGEGAGGRLEFSYRIEDSRLVVEISGGHATGHNELGRALVEATVDESEFSERSIRLTKTLDR